MKTISPDLSRPVEIHDLSFAFDAAAAPLLDIERFSVDAGERVMVRGPSGSGKSTLLNLIAGVLRPQRGTVVVDGTKVSALTDAQARAFRIDHIGFIFQDFALIDYLTVAENILLPYRINPASKLDAAVRERMRNALNELGIAHKQASYPARLSFGERQRTAIARAMISGPKLILADEPTANLDASNATRTIELILATAERTGAAAIVVSHDPALARHFGRVVEMESLNRSAAPKAR